IVKANQSFDVVAVGARNLVHTELIAGGRRAAVVPILRRDVGVRRTAITVNTLLKSIGQRFRRRVVGIDRERSRGWVAESGGTGWTAEREDDRLQVFDGTIIENWYGEGF